MKEVIDFFRRLHDDNTREWFDAHRAEWIRVKGRFADFTGQLIEGIASFDPEVRGLRPQDCTYRIARDTQDGGNGFENVRRAIHKRAVKVKENGRERERGKLHQKLLAMATGKAASLAI